MSRQHTGYRQRRVQAREVRRNNLDLLVDVPVSAQLRAYDPLERRALGRVWAVFATLGLIVGALVVHGAVLAAFFGVGMWVAVAEVPKEETITVAIVEQPKPPEPVKPVPEPPEPEELAAVEEVKVEEPKVEEVKGPEPPKPKPKPRRKKPAPSADPIDVVKDPPKEPVKQEPRRIVGLNLESTVKGGDGPSFAAGNTRMGTTDGKAEDQRSVKKIPAGARGGTPGASSGTPNKVASRIPQNGVSYTSPKRKGAIRPAFPEMLRRRGIEGNVVVMVTISAEGLVTNARVVKGTKYPEFNAAALRAARRERFVPATKNGVPIAYNLKYAYRFRLND